MKKLVLALVLAAPLLAQTTTRYTLQTNFNCDVSQTRPLTSIYQFDCRGITFVDPTTGNSVKLFMFNVANFYWTLEPANQTITGVRSFQVNMNGNPPPGPFQVFWTVEQSDGSRHTGMFTGNWQVVTTPLGGQRPEILAGATFDEDVSTVAILD